MSATPDMLAIFYEPTPPSEIRQRQGPNGRTLDYIDARYVMDTLDKLGPENWQDRYEDRADGSVRCGIGINVEGEWIWKWDVGTQSDIEPEKGSHSEAFKRAGVKWGIARDLYGHTTQARGGSSPRASQSPRPVSPPAPVGASNPDEPPFPGHRLPATGRRPARPAFTGSTATPAPSPPRRLEGDGKSGPSAPPRGPEKMHGLTALEAEQALDRRARARHGSALSGGKGVTR
jgi:hypothetical protein